MIVALTISAQASAGVLDISRIGMGARSLGMGRAQAAAADLGASFVNPANLASFNTFSMTSMYSNLSDDAAYTMLGGVFPLKEGNYGYIGIGYIGAGVSGISVTTSEARSGAVSSTDYSSRLLIVSYAKEAGSFVRAGVSAKFFTRSFDSLQNAAATGADLDIGFLLYPLENLTAGLSMQNILSTQLSWRSGANEDIPSNIKMGISFSPRKDLKALLDYDSNQQIHAGAEWRPKEFLSLRGGIEKVPVSSRGAVINYSLGVGLGFRGINFDYAYYIDTLLPQNSSHFFSLSYALPEKTVESRPILPASREKPGVSFN